MVSHAKRPDAVTPTLHDLVIRRDMGCLAPALDRQLGTDLCADVFGNTGREAVRTSLQLHHVQSGYGKMGQRAPSDPAHLITLCAHHHLDGWATSHVNEVRGYLERVTGQRWIVGPMMCKACGELVGLVGRQIVAGRTGLPHDCPG